MKLKKFLGFGVAFAAASLATVAVQAATYTAVSNVETSDDGQTVTMTVRVSDTSAVNGYALQLSYDPEVLEPVAAADKDVTGSDCYATTAVSEDSGVLVADLVDSNSDEVNDTVAVGWAAAEAISIDKTNGTDVATVKFNVLKKESTTVGVKMVAAATDADTVEDASEIEVADGEVTFGLLGDVDGDNEVTVTDSALVLQYAGKVIDELNDSSLADVDGDDEITVTDAAIILQYAGKIITEFPSK